MENQEQKIPSVKVKEWYDYPSNHFMHQYLRGKKGLNKGLDNNLGGLNKYLHGIHMGRYYLIGADSGVGKTTFADFAFVLNAYYGAKKAGRQLTIYYYSFEISKAAKISRWISFLVQKNHNVLIPSEYIMGRIEGVPVTDEHHDLIMEAYQEVEEILKSIVFVEDPVHPTMIYYSLIDYHYAMIGEIKREEPTPEQKKNKHKGRITGYTAKPGHEDHMTIIVVDHIALTASEKGMDTKATIDKLSSYFVTLRNLFGATIVVIQQFNSDLQTFGRQSQLRSKTDVAIIPQKLDFGDSKYTYRDADVVIGLVSPNQFEISQFMGVDIEYFRSYYLCAVLMKHRYGTPDKMISFFVNFIAGTFEYIKEARIEHNPFLQDIYSPKIQELEKCQELFSQPNL